MTSDPANRSRLSLTDWSRLYGSLPQLDGIDDIIAVRHDDPVLTARVEVRLKEELLLWSTGAHRALGPHVTLADLADLAAIARDAQRDAQRDVQRAAPLGLNLKRVGAIDGRNCGSWVFFAGSPEDVQALLALSDKQARLLAWVDGLVRGVGLLASGHEIAAGRAPRGLGPAVSQMPWEEPDQDAVARMRASLPALVPHAPDEEPPPLCVLLHTDQPEALRAAIHGVSPLNRDAHAATREAGAFVFFDSSGLVHHLRGLEERLRGCLRDLTTIAARGGPPETLGPKLAEAWHLACIAEGYRLGHTEEAEPPHPDRAPAAAAGVPAVFFPGSEALACLEAASDTLDPDDHGRILRWWVEEATGRQSREDSARYLRLVVAARLGVGWVPRRASRFWEILGDLDLDLHVALEYADLCHGDIDEVGRVFARLWVQFGDTAEGARAIIDGYVAHSEVRRLWEQWRNYEDGETDDWVTREPWEDYDDSDDSGNCGLFDVSEFVSEENYLWIAKHIHAVDTRGLTVEDTSPICMSEDAEEALVALADERGDTRTLRVLGQLGWLDGPESECEEEEEEDEEDDVGDPAVLIDPSTGRADAGLAELQALRAEVAAKLAQARVARSGQVHGEARADVPASQEQGPSLTDKAPGSSPDSSDMAALAESIRAVEEAFAELAAIDPIEPTPQEEMPAPTPEELARIEAEMEAQIAALKAL